MFKNAADIMKAVDAGRIIHWANNYYTVRKDKNGNYNIVCEINKHVIGLTWNDGKTLNGELWDFYDEYKTKLGDIPPASEELTSNREIMMLNEIHFLRKKLQEAAGIPAYKSWNYPQSYLED